MLQAVGQRGAYANLVLPGLLRERGLDPRDAALATELAYGTVRSQGILDAILARCSTRPPADLESAVLDVLRLGAYQLLRTRIPTHAAVSATVDLARATAPARAVGLVNAVLRRVSERDWDAWADLVADPPTEAGRLAARYAHPSWIAEAFAAALGPFGTDELTAALAADDARPQTHLVARPGRVDRDELSRAAPGAGAGPYSPYAVRMSGGDPAQLAAVRDGRAGVQDEGSQLCAIAMATVPIVGRDEQWLDLCAGPGGKAALLAALAAARGARLTANELREHRAALVRRATAFWDVPVLVGDAAEVPLPRSAPDESDHHGFARDGSAQHTSAQHTSAQHTSAQDGSARDDSEPNGSAHHGLAPDGSAHHRGSAPDAPDGDGSEPNGSEPNGSAPDGGYDRVLLDAPCTGLGALRRRPEARWRRHPSDVTELAAVQSRLLDAAARLVRPGGVIGYVTCSPHLGETEEVVAAAVRRLGLEPIDARACFPGVPRLGPGPTVQLWPHRQGTDAMFCALLRRPTVADRATTTSGAGVDVA